MRKVLKYIFHNIVCFVLLRCRVDLLLQNRSTNKRLIIMYHGVRKGNHRINGRHITAEQFEKQLQYFQKKFTLVSLHELCAMRKRGITPEKHTIALSFDDGFLNHLTVALPLLEKYRVPATFFICTAGILDPAYAHPTDRIDLIRVAPEPLSIQIGEETFCRRGHKVVSRKDGAHAYHYINGLTYAHWLKANSTLKDQLDDKTVKQNNELYQLMDDQSLRDLVKSDLVTVGSHSHHHINLTTLTSAETQYQFAESKKILESEGKAVDAIAFPYGYYNDGTIRMARAAGYHYFIAGGHVDPPFDQDVFPRIGVLDGAGFSYTMLMISKGFKRFGF